MSNLGERMKQYESVSKGTLMKRIPVIIRIDGRAFHTFTRGFKKPFDDILIESMQETMSYLCENIQGCVMGYTQSDEITLVLTDYKTLNTSAWFDYEVQKICSIAASMATLAFNKCFNEKVETLLYDAATDLEENGSCRYEEYGDKMFVAMNKGAMFDARCFNIPKEEVANNILWRQFDASRNSIQMVARTYYSHKELVNKSTKDLNEMLMDKGVNWNDIETHKKRGSCCIKDENGEWTIDKEIPIFTGEDRKYIERRINYVESN